MAATLQTPIEERRLLEGLALRDWEGRGELVMVVTGLASSPGDAQDDADR